MFKDPINFGTFLVIFLQFILFLHLVAFLSLVIKRGALPLAIAIQYLGGGFFMGIITTISMAVRFQGIVFVIAFGCLAASVFLHYGIGYRLVRAAAEE